MRSLHRELWKEKKSKTSKENFLLFIHFILLPWYLFNGSSESPSVKSVPHFKIVGWQHYRDLCQTTALTINCVWTEKNKPFLYRPISSRSNQTSLKPNNEVAKTLAIAPGPAANRWNVVSLNYFICLLWSNQDKPLSPSHVFFLPIVIYSGQRKGYACQTRIYYFGSQTESVDSYNKLLSRERKCVLPSPVRNVPKRAKTSGPETPIKRVNKWAAKKIFRVKLKLTLHGQ